jgi:hypothetical protein
MQTVSTQVNTNTTFTPGSCGTVKDIVLHVYSERIPLVEVKDFINNESSFTILDLSIDKTCEQ